MKPHLDIQHTGTITDANRVKMTFDENSIAHLMSVLTDLYSDPMTAVIREYSTNALDSHRAAGITDPIVVSLPTSIVPMFVVRDHGVGMTVDEVLHNFSKYGWSSKRETDGEVGMLGLGCKSGLTYTSQFTFIAIKGGVRAAVLVTREADGAGAVQVIDTSATDEHDGVEVQIPVNDPVRFNEKAFSFYRFWEPGTVLVNGTEPELLGSHDDETWLDPDILITSWVGADYIVMGNVPYPINDGGYGPLLGYGGNRHKQARCVIRVPIGAVNFTPSREALHYTKRTKETIADARTFVNETRWRVAQDEIDAAPNETEALRRADRWRASIPHNLMRKRFEYQGVEIPQSINAKMETLRWHSRDHSTASRTTHYRLDEVLGEVLFVSGHGAISIARPTKDKIKHYLMTHGMGHRTVIVSPTRIGSPWLDGLSHVDYATEIKPIKLPDDGNYPSSVRPPKAKYKMIGPYGKVTFSDDLDGMAPGRPTAWLFSADKSYDRDDLYRELGEKVNIVLVAARSEASFKKENPGVDTLQDWIVEQINATVKNMTPGQIVAWRDSNIINVSKLESFVGRWEKRSVMIDQFLDPELRDVLRTIRDSYKASNNWYSTLVRWAEKFQIEEYADVPESSFADKLKSVMKRYPVLAAAKEHYYGGDSFGLSHADFITYANALYYVHLSMPYCYDH